MRPSAYKNTGLHPSQKWSKTHAEEAGYYPAQ